MKKHLLLLFCIVLFMQCKPDSSKNVPKESATEPIVYSYKNARIPIDKLIDSLNFNKNQLRLHIDKSDYRLSVLYNEVTVKEYPVVFGTNPIDDKLIEGDRCTPEGDFKVRDFYPHKKWNKFIWINYPTADSWQKHRSAKAACAIAEEATIGGEIGIHGVPNNQDQLISGKYNWTWGCIAMTNKDVDDLYQVVYNDMLIEIRK